MGDPFFRRSRKAPFYITRKRLRSFCNLTAHLALASPARAREANFSVVVSRRIRLAESKKPGPLCVDYDYEGRINAFARASKRVDLILNQVFGLGWKCPDKSVILIQCGQVTLSSQVSDSAN